MWVDGNADLWPSILNEHIDALICSGILDCFATMYIGLVGASEQIERALKILHLRNVPFTVIAQEKEGYEQVTLSKIHGVIGQNVGFVLYCHNKGAMHTGVNADTWRRAMTFYNIYEFRECVQKMQCGYETVGIHWLTKELYANVDRPFYGGNFWWARTDYSTCLPRPKLNSRYDAENWISSHETSDHVINACNRKTGWPTYLCADPNT